MGSELAVKIVIGLVVAGFLGGGVFGIHKTGHSHERKIIAKSAAKAEVRADKAEDKIADIQGDIDPIILRETRTIIKTDREAAIRLGEVRGQLKQLRLDYDELQKQLSDDWGNADLPDGVRDQIAKIDKLLSGI